MRIRVSAIQYCLKPIQRFEEFAAQVSHQVKVAADFGAHFVLFPEFLTTQLISFFPPSSPFQAIRELAKSTDAYIDLFASLARRYNLHIIGGTHIHKVEDGFLNTAFFFYPDGKVKTQAKVHLTPTEKKGWQLAAGNGFEVFDTAWGKIAILICYDVEFPEAARIVADKGAEIIFCPSCTDDQWGFYRVRYCCHARAVENQVYVAHTGTVGSIPVEFMEANYSQASLISPCDIPFAKAGVVIEGEVNREMVVTGEFDLNLLRENRQRGSVTPFKDRRPEVYR